MKEAYLVFYLHGVEIAAYTVRGTFYGEKEATIELLAYENGVSTEAIQVTKEMR